MYSFHRSSVLNKHISYFESYVYLYSVLSCLWKPTNPTSFNLKLHPDTNEIIWKKNLIDGKMNEPALQVYSYFDVFDMIYTITQSYFHLIQHYDVVAVSC